MLAFGLAQNAPNRATAESPAEKVSESRTPWPAPRSRFSAGSPTVHCSRPWSRLSRDCERSHNDFNDIARAGAIAHCLRAQPPIDARSRLIVNDQRWDF
jgi:hypothetical protein